MWYAYIFNCESDKVNWSCVCFTAMYLFSVSTSSPAETSCQVVARAKRKYAHGGVPVQVGLIWSSGTNITTRCETRPKGKKKRKGNKSQCEDSQRKASNLFCSLTCKKSVWMLSCAVYFKRHILPEGYYLSLFWLIKNWGNFWESEQVTRLQDQIEEARWFFFSSLSQMMTSMLFFQLT